MKWLNYHHLLYFRTIATEGSISKASEKLRLGQPALSAQLKTLEESLGHQLFERKNRKLILTAAGKAALAYANEIHEKGQELLEVFSQQSFTEKQLHINIGALDSVPKSLITNLVEYCRSLGDCQVKVLEGRGEELIREIDSHQLDILISNYPAPAGSFDGIYSRPLGKVPINLYGAKKFKKLAKSFPLSIKDQPIVLPTSHSKLRQDIDHYLNLNGIYFKKVAEVQDTSVQKLLAVDGEGMIAIPEFSIKNTIFEKSLHFIGKLDGVFEEFWIISAQRTIDNPVVSKVIKDYNFKF